MICKVCGKLYERNGKEKCDECFEKEENAYKIVREYVASHNNVSAIDVNKATGIPITTILDFIEEGRIDLKKTKQRPYLW